MPTEKARAERVFVLRADLVSVEVRNLLQTAARAVLLSRRGSLAEQVKRLEESAPAAAPPPHRAPASRRPRAADHSRTRATRVFQRSRRLRRRRARIRDDPRRGTVDAGAVDQRHRQSLVRLSGLGRGRGYTWSINSRENQITPWSNDPVSDRPGEVIYVRDEDTGRALGSDGASDSRGTSPTSSARPGLQPFRAHLARNFARTAAVRAARRSDQDFAAEDPQSLGALAASLGHRLCRVGARHFARRRRRRSS